jgi:TolA-binding protein
MQALEASSVPSTSAPASAPARHVPASAPPTQALSTASPALSASALPEADSSRDFRAAMSALDGGDNTAAAARFAAFLTAHPRDARAEDAAYLRVIALQRASNLGTMKEAAAQYLRRYPKGFRRAEVETLSR